MDDLERLVAIEDLRRLQASYVRYADSKDWRALAGLFLPGAQFIPYGMDGKPQVTMTGPDEIERSVSAAVGTGTALHHLFSYEIDIESPTRARGLWSMEDRIERNAAVRSANASTEAEGPDAHGRPAPAEGGPQLAGRPFRTMHGYGHYHVDYEKVDGAWFIAGLKLIRTKLDFTY